MHTFQHVSSTVCMLMFIVLMTLHNINLSDANSITKQESLDQTVIQDTFTNCSTNSECSTKQGQTCVSGTCLCNGFGWIYDSNSRICHHYTCTLHENCRSHFGQGAFCHATEHYCACATEIDNVTQKCANPFLKINTKCTKDFTCERKYGSESICKSKVCECMSNYRFSSTEGKCVPMDPNVYVNDLPKGRHAGLYYVVALVPLLLACVCVINCSRGSKGSGRQRHIPGQPTLLAIQAFHKNSKRRPSPHEVVIIFTGTPSSTGSQSIDSTSCEMSNVVECNPIASTSNTQQNSIAPTSTPKVQQQSIKPLDPVPNYIESLFDSTKVELNLQQPKGSENSLPSPGSPLPPLYDSLAEGQKLII